MQIRHNVVENLDLKSNFVNVKSTIKKPTKKEWDIPEVGGGTRLSETLDLKNLTDKELKQLELAVKQIEEHMTKSTQGLKSICETLMVELKYMICEYKSPFINISL